MHWLISSHWKNFYFFSHQVSCDEYCEQYKLKLLVSWGWVQVLKYLWLNLLGISDHSSCNIQLHGSKFSMGAKSCHSCGQFYDWVRVGRSAFTCRTCSHKSEETGLQYNTSTGYGKVLGFAAYFTTASATLRCQCWISRQVIDFLYPAFSYMCNASFCLNFYNM